MVQIVQEIRHESGIPLGGIGTGSVEIRPDGLLHEWQVFNCGPWSPHSPCCGNGAVTARLDDLLFLVRACTAGGRPVVRYLALHAPLHELYSFSWLKCVRRIGYDGRFPLARLVYEDPLLPVDVEGEFFSPFVPHDSRTSGTPGFLVAFRIHNRTAERVEVSLLCYAMNLSGLGQENRKPRNRVLREANRVLVLFEADDTAPDHCSTGSLALSMHGDDLSWIGGAFRHDRGIQYVVSRYGFKNGSFLLPFRDTGVLPKLNAEGPPVLPETFSAAALDMAAKRDLLRQLCQHPFVHERRNLLLTAEPDLEQEPALLDAFLDDLAVNLNAPGQWHRALRSQEWGAAALCNRMCLEPGADAETRLVYAWHLPNHKSAAGVHIGHRYEGWFADALQVNRFLSERFDALRQNASTVPDLIHGSSLDPVCADALTTQLSTLVKCTWWTRDGVFGVWEGLGCCGFHTMDITYQGSFPILALFPDLQRAQLLHGAKFQRADGRVHHLFTPDFSTVDQDYDRVDMNPQFVMLVARDYQWTGDRSYLEMLWPHVVRAMDSTAALDADGDGLPDHETRRNTYDAWDFAGCPSYIAGLWLAALRAAVSLAQAMGDSGRARAWSELLERGRSALERGLWNGEYYVLWRDFAAGTMDECCMSDQLSGDWFCATMGWPGITDPDRRRRALAAIVRHNFSFDRGLVNASYPPGKAPRVPTVANLQADATWTGIEYTVAALLLASGLVDEGLDIVRDIHERYVRAGRVWNHVECGEHYYRALSSWSLLPVLTGFRLDAASGLLGFSPVEKAQDGNWPFFAPVLFGSYRQQFRAGTVRAEIQIVGGQFNLRVLSLAPSFVQETVTLHYNGKPIRVASTANGDLNLLETLPLRTGDRLHIGQ